MEIPRFNGDDAMQWLYKTKRFLNFHKIHEEQRVIITAFAFEEKACEWYQWMDNDQRLST